MAGTNKPDTLLNTLAAVGRMALMLIGIVGIAVEIFRDDGLLKQLFSKMLDSPTALAFIPIAIIAIYFFNRWLTSASAGKASKRGDLPLYMMMAIGAFFLFRLVTTGSL